ncbi:toll/interleukin-1 receptor domain-containing protein [Cycloclasticus sp.]|uniref:toll/interleukin-1 receptor domain-containing protein n=1 Tax=Cycloclasticus sp. TaxID=2024830 RepID=UPI000C0C999A|nr:toll/interleukin-1 receptor domain-containing protein [Cycloclasticus sp.]PHR52136.1 MAG: hypothetical protein COA48_03440 [Cycloclasticus sp.]
MSDSSEDEERKKLEEMGIEFHNDIPIFPFVPDRIIESRFYVVEAGELIDESSISEIIELLWGEPESDVYYFFGHEGGPTMDAALSAAKARGDILLDEMERRYYKHPKFKRDYIQITPKGDNIYSWPWEKDVVDEGPEFWRVKLKLSNRKREELDTWRKVQLEEHYRKESNRKEYIFDVFLSYSVADSEEVKTIHDKLKEANFNVFMAPKVLKPGDDFAEKIKNSLIGSKELWLLVSPTSIKSEWVISEWGAAWVLSKKIVPILHRCSPEALPDRLRRLHCTDLHKCDELISELVTPN